MADQLFEEPRLADLYDLFDSPEREDLDPYVAMAAEFDAQSVLDLGCGTGNLACRLAALGKTVTGVDPALASLAVARRKPFAERVQWLHGTAASIAGMRVDMITMTGNVAQVFVTDVEWAATLRDCRAALRPGGRLVFEVRDPAREAWQNWNRARTYEEIVTPAGERVESWTDLLDVQLPLVTFRHTFVFHGDGQVLTSDSTLRFRSKAEITDDLTAAGLCVEDVRDAPDRPGLEFVFVTTRPLSE
ncbi:class I SAM-dependent methyltransferase [Paenibacillus sp. GCM10023250]|uniref:class I SAM-dependent methyltransferase n=1 Tax=Paenibacillus sp. GCM10023250 TaxID=3252648 RepID=UPI0036242887